MIATTLISICTSLGSLVLVVFLAVSNKRLRREKLDLECKVFAQNTQINWLKCQLNNLTALSPKKGGVQPHYKTKGKG